MLSAINTPFAMNGPQYQLLASQLSDPKNVERLMRDPKSLKGVMGGVNALQAMAPYKAKIGKRLGIRDGVGYLYITGTLFKRESWITDLFGATTYETLRRDLQAALDHEKIESIALYVDSPGGEASGCDELAHAIHEARQKKPMAAFISGQGCSAAYWVATAAGRVVVSGATMVGSVGVVQSYERRTEAGVETHMFVSSQSPNKGFVPDWVQSMVDAMANVFVSHVAKHRGISTKAVIDWQGGVEIGANAVKAGMADAVGSFEDVIADLRKRPVPISAKPLSLAKPVAPQAPKIAAQQPAPVVQLSHGERVRIEAAAKAEAAEIARIREIFQKISSQEAASHYAYDTSMTANEALAEMKSEAIAASWRKAAAAANQYH
ncbi:S49 family peptidase [Pseudorhizobium flavum]|uniref:ClpP class serine protease n=1 Tax=Pseudorhizobium flavum TaxID=1335061 RepID=A0A7W9Z1Q0_9HYPH|nr:S49 family peptidase [Pseudorhizobium flavum]MBB6181561.1 ClpP class serine protease [Pseudorhizobium flavum]CAD6616613.1 S49 family peptidase [Pseudorhizobium flavum]